MSHVDTGVILAAGRGSRLKELSLEQPKPMTEVNNVSIIDNLLRQLIASKVSKIVIVVGYFSDKLQSHIEKKFKGQSEFVFINNEIYDTTNNIYSLYLAKDYINNGFFLFEADLFCDDVIMHELVNSDEKNIMLIDNFTDEMNGTVVRFDSSNKVTGMFLNKDQKEDFNFSDAYKTLNFYKLSKQYINDFFLKKLEMHIKGEDVNSYYEQIIKESIDAGYGFHGLVTKNHSWWEIDTIEDLERAEKIFG